MSIGFQPNVCGPLVQLVDCRKQQHEAYRASVLERIEKRNKSGAPLGDIDFNAHANTADELAKSLRAMDVPGAKSHALKISEALQDTLEDPGEFKPKESLDGVSVKLRLLSERERATLAGAHDDARAALIAATTESARASSYIDMRDARAAYIARGLAHIDGLQEWTGDVIKQKSFSVDEPTGKLSDECINLIRASDLLDDLFFAVVDFQGMPAKKAARFGLSPPVT